jgi:hypothetical protein
MAAIESFLNTLASKYSLPSVHVEYLRKDITQEFEDQEPTEHDQNRIDKAVHACVSCPVLRFFHSLLRYPIFSLCCVFLSPLAGLCSSREGRWRYLWRSLPSVSCREERDRGLGLRTEQGHTTGQRFFFLLFFFILIFIP